MTAAEFCIVVPVHKPDLSTDDIISLNACYNKLKDYKCFLVYPDGMDISKYLAIHQGLIPKPVKPVWLSSIKHYNQMKLDLKFYELFNEFKYMLTYELDAYIFGSDLVIEEFTKYDFIGAPYFEGYLDALPEAPFITGENSGFSIRNIQSCIHVLQSMSKYFYNWLAYKYIFSKSKILRAIVNRLTLRKYDAIIYGRFSFYFKDEYVHEDMIWSRVIPEFFPDFKIAATETAIKFSFEVNPDKLYKLNNNQLPLGCHAWPKFKYFWKDHIPGLSEESLFNYSNTK